MEKTALQMSGAPLECRLPPTLQQLQQLLAGDRHAEAVALLEGVDLEAETAPDWLYHAGISFNTLGRADPALGLLQRAASGGFQPFWCAYHLGLCEVNRGKPANAAYYLTVALLLGSHQEQAIRRHLDRVAPGIRPAALPEPRARGDCRPVAATWFQAGTAERNAGNAGAAVYYFTVALAVDPEHAAARAGLLQLAPDILLDLLPEVRGASGSRPEREQARQADRLRRELRLVKSRPAPAPVGRNLILGLAVNYDAEDLAPFVHSLRGSGYTGDVVLWVSSLDETTKTLLKQNDVRTQWYREPDFIFLNISLARFFCYYAFLRAMENKGQYADRILLLDVRDVVFQADPFAAAPEGDLLVYLEDGSMKLGSCTVNSEWLRDGFGADMLRRLCDRRISCSGSVFGTWNRVLEYLLMMQLVSFECAIEARKTIGIDQAIHNVLVHCQQIEPLTVVENGIHVLTMGYVAETEIQITPDNKIMDRHGRLSPILHQYDRHPAVQRLIGGKYRAALPADAR